jgi:1-acyl-sn-glycerol-3-phosphate acyltransferase
METKPHRHILQKPLTEWLFKFSNFHVHGLENLTTLDKTSAIFPFGPHCGHPDNIAVLKSFPLELRSKLVFLSAADHWNEKPLRNFLAQMVTDTYALPRKGYGPRLFKQIFEVDLPNLLINHQKSIVFSPEGTRNHPNMPLADRRFKSGLGAIVLSTDGKIPVIPIRIMGIEHVMPKGTKLPNMSLLHNAEIHVIFGQPVLYVDRQLPQNQSQARKSIALDIKSRMQHLQPTTSL